MTFVKKQPATTPAGVEQVIGAAAADLKRGLDAFAAVSAGIAGLGQQADAFVIQVNNRRAELEGLEVSFTEKERQLTVQMGLNLKEKGLTACTEMLQQLNKTIISTDELGTLRTNYQSLQASFKDDLQKAIGAASNVLTEQHKNAIALKDAQQRQEQAENTATIKAQTQQITSLEAQVKMLTEQLNEERKAGVQRAQANVAPVVNVGNQGR